MGFRATVQFLYLWHAHTVWNTAERAKDAPFHRNITGG